MWLSQGHSQDLGFYILYDEDKYNFMVCIFALLPLIEAARTYIY
jgi:hypothetical protein